MPDPTASERFVRLDLLGEGAMGRVWRARDQLLDRVVALKEPRGGPRSAAAARLRREGQLLGRLDHPGIVPLLFRGDLACGRPFIALRLAPGPDLRTWAAAHPAHHEQLAVLRGVVAAVAHAHRRGVVHRDLKPANIRVDADGTVTILDWGLARELTPQEGSSTPDGLTRQGARVGTPAYMSPEQAAGEVVGPEADVWSMGILMWEVLSGKRAYTGRAATEVLAGVLNGPPPSLRTIRPTLPAALVAVVDAALAPRAQRIPDAGTLLTRLDAARSPPAPRPPRRWPLAGMGLILGGLIGWSLQPTPPSTPPELDPDLASYWLSEARHEQLRAAACSTLAHQPDHPLARGVLLDADSWPRMRWSARTSACDIGEELRQDGRMLACASSDKLRTFAIDASGVQPIWERPDEVHLLQFAGTDQLIVWPAGLDYSLRLDARTGDRDVIDLRHLADARIFETRAPDQFVGRDAEGLIQVSAPPIGSPRGARLSSRRLPPDDLTDLFVLEDGSWLVAYADRIELRPGPDADALDTWAVPPGQGSIAHLILGLNERFVGALTTDDKLSVLDRTRRTWTPWFSLPSVWWKQISISPNGRLLAASALGKTTIWSTANPARLTQIDGRWLHPRFFDDRTIVVQDGDQLSLWDIPPSMHDPDRSLPSAPRGLVAWSGGHIGWTASEASWWPPGGAAAVDPGPVKDAAASPDYSRLAIARGSAGVAVLSADGQATEFDRPACRHVAWVDDQTLACVGSRSGPELLDLQTGTVDRSKALGDHRWVDIAARDGRVAVVDWDATIYDLTPKGLDAQTRAPWLTRIALASDGGAVLLNGRQGMVRRDWLVPEPETTDTIIVPADSRPYDFAVSPDGRRVAVAGTNDGLHIADIETGTLLWQIPSALGRVTTTAWMPDGSGVLVGLADGRVLQLDLPRTPCARETAAESPDMPAL